MWVCLNQYGCVSRHHVAAGCYIAAEAPLVYDNNHDTRASSNVIDLFSTDKKVLSCPGGNTHTQNYKRKNTMYCSVQWEAAIGSVTLLLNVPPLNYSQEWKQCQRNISAGFLWTDFLPGQWCSNNLFSNISCACWMIKIQIACVNIQFMVFLSAILQWSHISHGAKYWFIGY